MAKRESCYNCVFSRIDPEAWLRAAWREEPMLAQFANHPWWPGRLHDVPGVSCCNYRPKPAEPTGDSVRWIPLGDGFYAYVDAADYDWLSQWTWHMYEDGYPARYEKKRKIYMHREIMQPPKGMVVDHIDANRANNCRFNLRVCTREENSATTASIAARPPRSKASVIRNACASFTRGYGSTTGTAISAISPTRSKPPGPMTGRRSSTMASSRG